MDKGRVYSYLRFSDPKQAAGSSADRQTAYAERWAAARGMVLDASLSLRDEGLSAYHQRHVKQGALGAFLVAVDEGKITPGSVLVVEGLDRLSRAEPVLAQAQLAQIINAGITVVTASDGKEYNRARLKEQPMDLVYSLLVMIRAHEESDTKSKRVKSAIRRLCLAWQAGTYRGIIRNGKDPQWVRWTGNGFELVPERAEAMRAAVKLFLEGHGAQHILRTLGEQGINPEHLPGRTTSIYKSLKNPCLVGTKVLAVDGEEFALEGYYPALLDPADYARLEEASLRRVKRKGKGEIPGLITGIGILHCGYCGAAVVGQNLMSRKRKADGTLNDGHRRLICCGQSHESACAVGGSVSVVPVERALLAFCSDQLNLSALYSSADPTQAARARRSSARAQIAEIEKKLARITEALLADDEATPIAFVKKARELETELAEAKREETLAEADIARAGQATTPAVADRWHALAEAALALDYDARMAVRRLVVDTFEQIVLYHRGMSPDADPAPVDLLLIAKGGGTRLLRIHRKTGAYVAHFDT